MKEVLKSIVIRRNLKNTKTIFLKPWYLFNDRAMIITFSKKTITVCQFII